MRKTSGKIKRWGEATKQVQMKNAGISNVHHSMVDAGKKAGERNESRQSLSVFTFTSSEEMGKKRVEFVIFLRFSSRCLHKKYFS